MIRRTVSAALISILILLFIALPVLAIAPPDSTATIDAVNVYRSCLETNDQLYVIQYTISYASPPDEPVNEAYIFRLMDGATELGNSTAYAYDTDGYGSGVTSIYFLASDITEKSMTWNGAYTIVLAGNPILTWTGSGCPYVSISSFSAWNDPMSDALGTDVLVLAGTLSTDWGLTTTALFTPVSGTTTLSSYGEDYFGTSIPNLMTMQPNIFSSSSVAAQFYERTNPLTYAISIDHTYWAGTWIDDAIQPTTTALGISAATAYGSVWAVITIGFLLLITLKRKLEFEILLLLGSIITLFGTLLHFVPMLIPTLIGVVLVILVTFKHFFSPSTS